LRRALIYDERTSLFSKQGRANAKKDIARGKKTVDKIMNSKAFKATIYNKDGKKILSEKGKNFLQRMKDNYNKKQYDMGKRDIAALRKAGKNKEADEYQKEFDYAFEGYKR